MSKLAALIPPLPQFLRTFFFNPAVLNHVMIVGAKGESKTYTAEEMAQDYISRGVYDAIVRIQGSASMTEADFFGYQTTMPDPVTGQMRIVWADGQYTEAFRLASQGKKVIAIFDEIKQVSPRILSPMLTSMVKLSDGKIHLRTGRALSSEDGVASMEELVADPMNFRIIATANEGAGYQSADMSIALEDRFIKYHQKMSAAEFQRIIKSYVDAWRVPGTGCLPDVTTTQLVKLRSEQQKASQTGALAASDVSVFSIRSLSRILSNSGGTVEGLLAAALTMVFQHCEQNHNGQAIESQEQKHIELINACIGSGVLKNDPSLYSAMVSGKSASSHAEQAGTRSIQLDIHPGQTIAEIVQGINAIRSFAKTGLIFEDKTIDQYIPVEFTQMSSIQSSCRFQVSELAVKKAEEKKISISELAFQICSFVKKTIEDRGETVSKARSYKGITALAAAIKKD